MMTSLIKDSSTGKPCNAKMWFSAASVIVLGKFALSGMTIAGATFGEFDATGASMLIGAFGAIYGVRAHDKKGMIHD